MTSKAVDPTGERWTADDGGAGGSNEEVEEEREGGPERIEVGDGATVCPALLLITSM